MTERVYAAGFLLSAVIDGERRWLLLQNARRGDWGFAKGHREAGESDFACALRECAEETGIALLEVTGDPIRLTYDIAEGVIKEVCYYPAECEVQAAQISKEHLQVCWCDRDAVLAHLPFETTKAVFRQYLQQQGYA